MPQGRQLPPGWCPSGRRGEERRPASLLPPVKDYYDARAPEYDEWYLGQGKFAGVKRPDWDRDVRELELTLAGLPPARTLDVACGTGFLTQHLAGEVTLFDHSPRMLAIASRRLPQASALRGDALGLPFGRDAFERVFTAHFYGHLEDDERRRFLAEARRIAPELVVVDAAVRSDHGRAEWQERVLNDGACFEVYKRFFGADELVEELGGGTVLLENSWFIAVASRRKVGCEVTLG